jgi:hypothetical protein
MPCLLGTAAGEKFGRFQYGSNEWCYNDEKVWAADFGHAMSKLIYAWRMMCDICRSNMIPAEQFATTVRTAIYGVMAKQLGFFDKANTLHITAAVDQVDAEQCYNAVLHSVTSVGLQAHHVPLAYVLLYLQAMAEMQFHL